MKKLILILAALLLCSSAWAAQKVQVMTNGTIDIDRLPTIDFSLEADPASPETGRVWWNETTKQLKVADALGIYSFNGTLAGYDTTPDAFSFADVVNATTNSTYTSAPITVAGINHPAAISVSGDASAKYSVNNATATAVNGTVAAGDQVRAVVTSSASAATAVNATVTIGGVSDALSVTTAGSPAERREAVSVASLNNWSSSSGDKVADIAGIDSDNIYITTAYNSQTFNKQTTANASPESITIVAYAKRAASGSATFKMGVHTGGTAYYGATTVTLTDSYEKYTVTFDENPATSSAWTTTTINSALILVRAEAISSSTVYVDRAYAEIQ